MKATFEHVKISGISTFVPPKCINIDSELDIIYNGDVKALERIKKVIGLQNRFVAEENIATSDIGEIAANSLIEDMGIDRGEIDGIIVVTQTPDYFLPATACYLHGKLNLSLSAAAFDINQACAGYLYGLFVAHSLIESGSIKRILLICGDTLSKMVNPRDSNLAPIIGDGVSATFLEYTEKKNNAFFELGSDGKKFYQLIIPEGAMRIPTKDIIKEPKVWEVSELRNLRQLYMDGAEIFNFAVQKEPEEFLKILEYANCSKEEIDYVFLHQANKYIVDNIVKRLKLDPSKVPNETTTRYGNLSGCSIPATICDTINSSMNKLSRSIKVSLSGFGAGLSWGNAIVNLESDFFCREVQKLKY